MLFLRRLWKIPRGSQEAYTKLTIRLPKFYVNFISVPSPVPKSEADY
jgi:hypothetical protein